MDTKQAEELLERYSKGRCSASEIAILESWYDSESLKKPDDDHFLDYDELYLGLESALRKAKNKKRYPVILKWAIPISIVTAAALLLVFFNIFTYNTSPKKVNIATFAKDRKPAEDGASLLLADGKEIYLSGNTQGTIAENEDMRLSRNAIGQLVYESKSNGVKEKKLNVLRTAGGQHIEMILPDGSKVLLNAASTISYPSNFSNVKERVVSLMGQAYFEVRKDSSHPFVVKSLNQSLKVLGTHFIVDAYNDEPLTKTTLIEGSVSINNSKPLQPGEQALNASGMLTIKKADLNAEMAWIKGDFHFEEESMASVMRTIGRWYDMDVEYSAGDMQAIPLSGSISRKKSLSVVLERISKATGLRFTIRNRSIYVQEEK